MNTQNPFIEDQSVGVDPTGRDALRPAPTPQPKRSLFRRVRNVLSVELGNLRPRLALAEILIVFLPNLTFGRLRTAIYRMAGIQIGSKSMILGRLTFAGYGTGKLRIGTNTIINAHCTIDLNADIDIGNHVSMGHHVTLITADHELGPAACRAGPMKAAPIAIGSGTWICARSIILPGVTIGRSCVVAAGSLVSGNVPPNRVIGGVPARALKSLPPEP